MLTRTQQKSFSMRGEKWWDKKLIKEIAKIGIPAILLSIVFGLNDLIDNVSLGLWGAKGSIAIVGYANRLYWFAMVLVVIFPPTFNFLVSQYHGAKKYEKEKSAIGSSIFFSTAMAIIMLIIIYFAGSSIIGFFVTTSETDRNYVISEATKYMKVMGWLILIEGILQSFSLGVIVEGKVKWPTIIHMITIPVNFLLNYLFMNTLNMGRMGSAWSTLITFMISMFFFLLWIYIGSKKKLFHFGVSLRHIFIFDKVILKKAFSRITIGLTSIINELIIILALTAMTRNYGHGATVLGIVSPFFNILLFAGAGILSTKSRFVGKELGAGNFKKAYTNDAKMNLYAFVFGWLNIVVLLALAYPLPMIFIRESQNDQLTSTYALIGIALSYPFKILSNGFAGSLKIGGRGIETLVSTTVWQAIFELGIFWVIAAFAGLPFIWVYSIYRFFKASSLLISYLFWKRKTWITNETHKEKTSQIPIIEEDEVER